MSEFKKEERYIVVKIKHLTPRQKGALIKTLVTEGVKTVDCVVVESDWANYSHVWDTIEQVERGEFKF